MPPPTLLTPRVLVAVRDGERQATDINQGRVDRFHVMRCGADATLTGLVFVARPIDLPEVLE